jgi:hypothetical protein
MLVNEPPHEPGQKQVVTVECSVPIQELPTPERSLGTRPADNTQEAQQEEAEELCGIGLRFTFRAGMSEVRVA